jgi:hypothetical protein
MHIEKAIELGCRNRDTHIVLVLLLVLPSTFQFGAVYCSSFLLLMKKKLNISILYFIGVLLWVDNDHYLIVAGSHSS